MTADGLIPRVRLYVFEHFLKHAQAPVGEQLMTEFSLSRDEATDILRQLESVRHIALVPRHRAHPDDLPVLRDRDALPGIHWHRVAGTSSN